MSTYANGRIAAAPPRATVQVTFPDGLILEAPVGTTIEAFLRAVEARQPGIYATPVMGGILDGKLRELSFPVTRDAPLEAVLLASSDGSRIYRRSLVLLLTAAVDELFPNVRVSVNYAVPDGGYFCHVLNRAPFNADELVRLEAHMRAIVAADDPITQRVATLDEAIALFQARGDDDKVRLLEQRSRNELKLYTLRGRSDYYYGYMVPSSGYLTTFRVLLADNGFIVQYPQRDDPAVMRAVKPDKITQVFHQADQWLQRMGVEDIGRLNRIVRQHDRLQELILVAEALHEQNVAHIAHQIHERHTSQGMRLVLISGPSSSGKTTFAKRLAIQLLAHGLRPFTLEMDNYFVDRELTPRDEHGEYDFEHLHTVNLPLFNTQLLQLINGEQVQLPRFDFTRGKSAPGKLAQLERNQIIIIEGIHGLNPELVPNIPPEKIYRVYVSALTQLNVDSHNRVPTTDTRLLRRVVRDAQFRGYSATDTLLRWQSVRRGERRNIFVYQENADAMFNSTLVYELAALRPLAEPLLLQVEPGTHPHIEANRLLSFLRWVQPLTPEQQALIPDTSLLREFIGGSILEGYHPGTQDSDESRIHAD